MYRSSGWPSLAIPKVLCLLIWVVEPLDHGLFPSFRQNIGKTMPPNKNKRRISGKILKIYVARMIEESLKFPSAVVLNAVGCRNTQKSTNERKRAQTKKRNVGKRGILYQFILSLQNGRGRWIISLNHVDHVLKPGRYP